jgi:hypothetical protein
MKIMMGRLFEVEVGLGWVFIQLGSWEAFWSLRHG